MHVPFPHNPMHVATMAQKMAANADGMDSKVFQKVAMVSMGVMAVASVAQMLAPLLRELNRKHDHEDCRGR
jgi:hypothetical protein